MSRVFSTRVKDTTGLDDSRDAVPSHLPRTQRGGMRPTKTHSNAVDRVFFAKDTKGCTDAVKVSCKLADICSDTPDIAETLKACLRAGPLHIVSADFDADPRMDSDRARKAACLGVLGMHRTLAGTFMCQLLSDFHRITSWESTLSVKTKFRKRGKESVSNPLLPGLLEKEQDDRVEVTELSKMVTSESKPFVFYTKSTVPMFEQTSLATGKKDFLEDEKAEDDTAEDGAPLTKALFTFSFEARCEPRPDEAFTRKGITAPAAIVTMNGADVGSMWIDAHSPGVVCKKGGDRSLPISLVFPIALSLCGSVSTKRPTTRPEKPIPRLDLTVRMERPLTVAGKGTSRETTCSKKIKKDHREFLQGKLPADEFDLTECMEASRELRDGGGIGELKPEKGSARKVNPAEIRAGREGKFSCGFMMSLERTVGEIGEKRFGFAAFAEDDEDA